MQPGLKYKISHIITTCWYPLILLGYSTFLHLKEGVSIGALFTAALIAIVLTILHSHLIGWLLKSTVTKDAQRRRDNSTIVLLTTLICVSPSVITLTLVWTITGRAELAFLCTILVNIAAFERGTYLIRALRQRRKTSPSPTLPT